MRHKQNVVVSSTDWNDTPSPYHHYDGPLMTPLPTTRHQPKRQLYNTIFSDDDDDDPVPPQQRHQLHHWSSDQAPSHPHSGFSFTPSNTSYVDPLLSSSTYHIHQAENALSTLKHVILQDGWKKALKHKSGVVVHMMNGLHKADKTPIFKGEAVIHGFSPQAIFYVIGMRKLWDEQYEDGNLVENLNDTTSLTYEVTKPTTTSKSRDFSLVERIECTQNGSIIFVATSVETTKLPRVQGRTRAQIKLQGWILEPIRGVGPPSTKVTFVLQENMKGWVPGFAKKTLARRPLVIALINDYLQKKSERSRASSKPALAPLTYGHSRRPSLLTQRLDLPTMVPKTSSPSPTPSQRSILLGSNASTLNSRKRITFASQGTSLHQDIAPDDDSLPANDIDAFPKVPSMVSTDQPTYSYIDQNTALLAPPHNVQQHSPASDSTLLPPSPPPSSQVQQKLYPIHRHSNKKAKALAEIKELYLSPEDWVLKEEKQGIRYYSKDNYLRADGTILGGWTPEQICSLTHSCGARKVWDNQFKHGEILERFSQKDYLQRWTMKNGTSYVVTSTIDSDISQGTIYTSSTSVDDTTVAPGSLPLNLYGWIFTPVKQEKRCVKASVIWDTSGCFSSTTLPDLINFLATIGCPPYIRRVAGKVLNEELIMMDDTLDGITATKKDPVYTMKYVVKHEPSSSYRARKSNPEKHWCTDIRVHPSLYPLGFDVSVSPSSGTNVNVSAQYIKVFTTSSDLEGQEVSVTVAVSHAGKITCNGALVLSLKDIPIQLDPPAKPDTLKKEEPKFEEEIKANEQSQPDHSQSEAPIPLAINDSDMPSQHTPGPQSSPIQDIQVPEGYMLVSKHHQQTNNILIISDDLTFNGQQLAVMFVAMLLCYYTGKFACAC